MAIIQVSQEFVASKFTELQLFGPNVVFVKGFFNESCPRLRKSMLDTSLEGQPIHPEARAGKAIAVLRMDGDMYESTMDIMFNLYDFVPLGGYVIVDDYHIPEAQAAVIEFLRIHGAQESFTAVDVAASYWQKTVAVTINATWYAEFNKRRQHSG